MVLLCDWLGARTPSHGAFYEVSVRGRHCVAVCSVCYKHAGRTPAHVLSQSLTRSLTLLVNISLSYSTSLHQPPFSTALSHLFLPSYPPFCLLSNFPPTFLSSSFPNVPLSTPLHNIYSLLIIKTYAGTAPLRTMLT